MVFKPRIMVVDDDQAILRMLGELLEEMGAQPHLLSSSPHAAELLNQEKFDGAIIDWRLPEMDGLELARRIRSSKSNSTMPVVMLSGAAGRPTIETIFTAGVNFFLEKPVSVTQLRHLLNATRGAMLTERRRYQRAPVSLRVRCHWRGRQLRCQSVNLSSTGILVALEDPPPKGAEVNLEFSLPRSIESLRFSGTVARVTEGPAPGHASGRSMAIEFSGADARHRRLVMDFVEETLKALRASE